MVSTFNQTDAVATPAPVSPGLHLRRFVPVAMLVSLLVLVPSVSADICWTTITSITDGIGTDLIPSFVTLITAAVPLLIVMAVISFVMGFLDKILAMLTMK